MSNSTKSPRVGNQIKLNGTCKNDDIQPDKLYLVKKGNSPGYKAIWWAGSFTEQWYGWNFYTPWMGTAGIQLDSLAEVWELHAVR